MCATNHIHMCILFYYYAQKDYLKANNLMMTCFPFELSAVLFHSSLYHHLSSHVFHLTKCERTDKPTFGFILMTPFRLCHGYYVSSMFDMQIQHDVQHIYLNAAPANYYTQIIKHLFGRAQLNYLRPSAIARCCSCCAGSTGSSCRSRCSDAARI